MKGKRVGEGKIDSFSAAGGGRALLCEPGRQNILSILISFKDGVAFEEESEWGISHLIEHLHFQGTPRHPSLTAMTGVIEEEGGKISAFSTRDCTSYFAKVPDWGMEKAFQILAEILLNQHFDPETVASEKSIVLHELAKEKANYSFYNSVQLECMTLSPLPISRYPIGTRDAVSHLTAESIESYKKKSYVSGNCFVTVVGAFRERRAHREISALLDSLPDGTARNPRRDSLTEKAQKIALLEYPAMAQVNVAAGWGIKDDRFPDWIPWNLLNTLLGVGFGALLYRTLREEHRLTYLVSTALRIYLSGGVFKVTLDVKPEDVGHAIDLIGEVIAMVRNRRIDEGDLLRAKTRMWGNMVLRKEDTLEYARFLNRLIMTECDPRSLQEIKELIFKVSADELAELAERFLSDEARLISLAGSRDSLEKAKII